MRFFDEMRSFYSRALFVVCSVLDAGPGAQITLAKKTGLNGEMKLCSAPPFEGGSSAKQTMVQGQAGSRSGHR